MGCGAEGRWGLTFHFSEEVGADERHDEDGHGKGIVGQQLTLVRFQVRPENTESHFRSCKATYGFQILVSLHPASVLMIVRRVASFLF